jgi:hypothetical protein
MRKAVTSPTCPNPDDACRQPLRTAVHAALLDRNVRTFDGGLALEPRASVADGTPAFFSAVATTATMGDSSDVEMRTVAAATTSYEGVTTVDATALWTPALTSALGVDVMLRVSHLSMVHTDLPADEALEFTRDQLAAFNGDAAIWNRDLKFWNQQRDTHLQWLGRWKDAWNTYGTAFDEWRAAHRASWRELGRPRAENPPNVAAVPIPPPYASQETLAELIRSQRGVVRRLMGRITVEALDPTSGELLWVARASGEVAAGPGAEEMLTERMMKAVLDAE